ncbi:MAG: restriction endonuclease [Calothrix sp. FI2-JRJ7]|jgi:hypothetical protein|nr:restriction endonuclease [Calothrix sp. FI2-JRJ7]
MATSEQIRGMLLEEALLYLLRLSGYRTVEEVGNDNTLKMGSAGLKVLGRGSEHQIDAIADYSIAPPFSNSQRLLLEAKFQSKPTGINIIRNAVGVLKDVNEYWVSRDNVPPKARYHYQVAIFSTSDYTRYAQRYAYAHDVYLIPLHRSNFFQPVIQAIEAINVDNIGRRNKHFLRNFRRFIRQNLNEDFDYNDLEVFYKINEDKLDIFNIVEYDFENYYLRRYNFNFSRDNINHITKFLKKCHKLNGALMAMLEKQIPIFLVPNSDIKTEELENNYNIEISWGEGGYYIRELGSNYDMFSFDLPEDILNLYAEQGFLFGETRFGVEAKRMFEIQAIITSYNQVRVITLKLDKASLDELCRRGM